MEIPGRFSRRKEPAQPSSMKRKEHHLNRTSMILAKLLYFTNLGFPEIRGTQLESIRHSPCTAAKGAPVLEVWNGKNQRHRTPYLNMFQSPCVQRMIATEADFWCLRSNAVQQTRVRIKTSSIVENVADIKFRLATFFCLRFSAKSCFWCRWSSSVVNVSERSCNHRWKFRNIRMIVKMWSVRNRQQISSQPSYCFLL